MAGKTSKADKFKRHMGALPSREDAVTKSALVLESIVTGTENYRFVKVKNITFNPQNDYAQDDSPEDIRELAEDIKRNGLLHNIVLSYHEATGQYLLLSGERRVRAYMMNAEAEPDNKQWTEIYAKIRTELSEIEEAIILDAANLQARGNGARGEAKYRKATARFVNNLQQRFHLAEAEAIEMTKKYAGASDSTISRNINIEKQLIPALKDLLDRGIIIKTLANSYALLTEQEQKDVAQSYMAMLERPEAADVAQFGKNAAEAIKSNQSIKNLSLQPIKKPTTALERQKNAIEKTCAQIEKALKSLNAKTDTIRRLDQDNSEMGEETLHDRIDTLYEEFVKLRDALA